MYKYQIIIENAGSNYSAYAPDIPGCVATGKTIDEVKLNMAEAIEFHFQGLQEDGLPIPRPEVIISEVAVQVG